MNNTLTHLIGIIGTILVVLQVYRIYSSHLEEKRNRTAEALRRFTNIEFTRYLRMSLEVLTKYKNDLRSLEHIKKN